MTTTKVEGDATLPVKKKVVLGVGTDNVVGTRISVSDVEAGVKVDGDIDFLVVEDRVRVVVDRVVLEEEGKEEPEFWGEDEGAGIED